MLKATIENYSKYKSWKKFYKKGKSLRDCKYDESWKEFLEKRIFPRKEFIELDEWLKAEADVGKTILPKPEVVFNALFLTPINEIKVIILGQDPYFNVEVHNGKELPQAVGLSFSIPDGFKVPSSLRNIYKNQLKFGNHYFAPKFGNLNNWAIQGCLMLNTALTVEQKKPGSHLHKWKWMTDEIIKWLSYHHDGLIFMLWGSPAGKKMDLIDQDKHYVILSTHPSGMSYNKKTKTNEAFCDVDHFTEVNNILKKNGQIEIVWQVG